MEKILHIAIGKDFEVRAVSLTNNDIHDSYVVDKILKQEKSKINTFLGDGAYDTNKVYGLLEDKNIDNILIPPRKNTDKTKIIISIKWII